MLELIETFSPYQIVIFTILMAVAIKSIIEFIDWCKERYQNRFNADYNKKEEKRTIESYYQEQQIQHQQSIECYKKLNNQLETYMTSMSMQMSKLEKQIAQLIDSDRNDIKSWIVEKHHHFMKKGWVDDFTMDTIERRFSNYLAEDGNSYVEGLVNELRTLPHMPPIEEKQR